MSVTTICCVLGALLWDNMLMGVFRFRLCIVTYVIDLLTRAHYLWLDCYLYVSLWRKFSLFFVFITFFYASQSIGQTNLLNDRYRRQVLTAIPFKIRVNNSSKYLPLPAYEKRFAEFPCLYIFNSLMRHFSDSKCEATVFYLERTATRSSQPSHLKKSEIGWAPKRIPS